MTKQKDFRDSEHYQMLVEQGNKAEGERAKKSIQGMENPVNTPATCEFFGVADALTHHNYDMIANDGTVKARERRLKKSDFDNEIQYLRYGEEICKLNSLLSACENARQEEELFLEGRREAIEQLQKTVNFLRLCAGLREKYCNVDKRHFNYIMRNLHTRKKEVGGTIKTDVKGLIGLKSLVEDILYFWINNMKVPSSTQPTSVQKSHDRITIALAKHANRKKAEAEAKQAEAEAKALAEQAEKDRLAKEQTEKSKIGAA